jgi:hypothetical protein
MHIFSILLHILKLLLLFFGWDRTIALPAITFAYIMIALRPKLYTSGDSYLISPPVDTPIYLAPESNTIKHTICASFFNTTAYMKTFTFIFWAGPYHSITHYHICVRTITVKAQTVYH